MRTTSARTMLSILAAAGLLAAAACTSGGGGAAPGGGGTPAAPAAAAVDEAAAVEASIVASEGGTIGLKTAEAIVRVTIPADALPRDMTLVAMPLTTAPGEDAATLVKGFRLVEKGSDAGIELAHPAWVEWLVGKELGEDAAVVRFAEDGSAEPLPARMKAGKGVTAIQALTDHFTDVGIRGDKAKAKAGRASFADFNWVVYVNSTQSGRTGPIEQTVKLTMRAVNTGGDIAGDYSGKATIKSTNDASIMGGTMNSPQSGSGTAQITLTSVDPLAPLVPDPDPLASLTPDDIPMWWGSGAITMGAVSTGGPVTGQVGGYGGTGSAKNTSSLPVIMAVNGTQVDLTVTLAPGPMTFPGYVIGEGKK